MPHIHDYPLRDVYLPFGPRQPAPPKKAVPAATLAALQWAADRAGQSYGRFILNLSTAEQARIQGEYDEYLAARKEEMAARPRVDIDEGEAGFVISDGDV